MLKIPHSWGTAGQEIISFRRAILRARVTPMTVCPSSDWKRRLDRGIRITAYHPSPSRDTAASQKVFHAMLGGGDPSFPKAASVRRPVGVVAKRRVFCRSRNVSRLTRNQSFRKLDSSRRRDTAWIPSGSRSCIQAAA
jgi:hypothetical protein